MADTSDKPTIVCQCPHCGEDMEMRPMNSKNGGYHGICPKGSAAKLFVWGHGEDEFAERWMDHTLERESSDEGDSEDA